MKKSLFTVLLAVAALLFTAPARADHTNTHTNTITCDFTALAEAVGDLEIGDIQAPNNNARRGRLNSLENAVEAAQEAADDGHLADVLDALDHIAKKTGTNKNAWVTGAAAAGVQDALGDLLDCLDDLIGGNNGTNGSGTITNGVNGTNGTNCFGGLRGNGRVHNLAAGTNSCDLVVSGNGNRINGSTNGATIINGDLLVTGNKNVVRNLTVLGDVIIHGNKNRLVNVTFTGTVVETGNKNDY